MNSRKPFKERGFQGQQFARNQTEDKTMHAYYRPHELRIPTNLALIDDAFIVIQAKPKGLSRAWLDAPRMFKAVRARGFYYE